MYKNVYILEWKLANPFWYHIKAGVNDTMFENFLVKTSHNEILQTFNIDLRYSEARNEMPTHRSICKLNIIGHSHQGARNHSLLS